MAWQKGRRGRLKVQLRPGGDPVAPLSTVLQFAQSVDARLRTGQQETEHRRGVLTYRSGLAWKGELWLSDTLRLGPPSRFADAIIGPQALIVDALVSGIGRDGIRGKFTRILQELCLVLSPITGIYLEGPRNRSDWVPEIDTNHLITGCRIQLIGYTEIRLPPGMPVRGAAAPIARETVRRPGLERLGLSMEDVAERAPADLEELWRYFNDLSAARKQQYLNACNAYHIASRLWPDQRTAHAVFLVVACEALKPPGRRYDRANIYDVVSSLVDAATADLLEGLRVKPQKTRSEHVHRGVLAADEFGSLLLGDAFGDPSFDEMLNALSRVTRICLIEWLRRKGRCRLRLRPRKMNPNQPKRASDRTRGKSKVKANSKAPGKP
jgi:hypothetical protein